jgi:sarcosine oxidase, subunit beta
MAARYDVVIIGAGNLGLWTAYCLAKRGGRRIAVLERYWAGFGATSRSAGVVRQQGGSETAIKLGMLSRKLYLQLGEELGLDSGFIQTGYCILAEGEEEKRVFLDLVTMRRKLGMHNEWLEPGEGQRRFPDLNWDLFSGATFTPDDGNVHPPIAARNITIGATRAGVELFERCPVEAIDQIGGTFYVHSALGDFEAETVVDAGGPRGARAVGKMLEIEVPVSAARHEIVTFPTLNEGARHPFPMFFALSRGIYWRPEEQGALLGISNPHEKIDRSDRFQIAFDWAYYEQERPTWEAMYPALAGRPISRAWAASIDYTPDHLPIIDQPAPGIYVLAAGGHGMMWGPGLGSSMAELIDTGKPGDLSDDEIRLDRFSRQTSGRDSIALPFPTE